MRRFGTLLALILAPLINTPVHSQTPDQIKFYKDTYIKMANNYRNLIRPILSLRDQKIINEITFVFDYTQNINAYAYKKGQNERYIQVSYGFLVFMHNLMLAYAVTGEAKQPLCYGQYIDITARIANENSRALRTGKPLKPVPFFPAYLKDGGSGCEAIKESDLTNPAALHFVPGGMNALMAVVLGHEIAHHVLEHLDKEKPGNLKDSRRAETAADIWAAEHAFAISINPAPATPLWLFFSAIGGLDIGAEVESTHPLGIRRYAATMDIIVERLKSPDFEKRFGRVDSQELQQYEQIRDNIRSFVP